MGVCSAKNIGDTGKIDDDNYTCGCSIFDMTLLTNRISTNAEECTASFMPITWQKN